MGYGEDWYYDETPKPRSTAVRPPVPGTSSHVGNTGYHRPVLDIDMPVTLTPSKTPGHHHLEIERNLTWRQYKRLLRALAAAGIVERSWVRASIRSGASFVAR
jgi:hypothetical protein